jgi:hypothetical protein
MAEEESVLGTRMQNLHQELQSVKQQLKAAHESVKEVLHETAKGRRHVVDLEARLKAGPHGEWRVRVYVCSPWWVACACIRLQPSYLEASCEAQGRDECVCLHAF